MFYYGLDGITELYILKIEGDMVQSKMKIIILVSLFTFLNKSILAQGTAEIRRKIAVGSSIHPLSIGDFVPEITFQNIINGSVKEVKISDFKGKLVILDFWSVLCSSCISAFPRLSALQKKFHDKVQIFLTNPHGGKYDKEEDIKNVLEKFKIRTGFYPDLPIPILDTILNIYFPHKSVPHYVWIDKNGLVIAITGFNEVTEENISSFIDGKIISLPVKNDFADESYHPLLVEGYGGKPGDFLYRSLITQYNGAIGFGSGNRQNEKNQVVGYYLYNVSMIELVTRAYSYLIAKLPPYGFLTLARTIIDSERPEIFTSHFNPQYAFCYDLVIPPVSISDFNNGVIQDYLQQDLKRYFNLSVKKIKKRMDCYVLGASKKLNKIVSSEGKGDLEVDIDSLSIRKYIHNTSIDRLLGILEHNIGVPLINETGISSAINIDFPREMDLRNVKQVIKFLLKIGFEVHKEERIIDVFVISDR